MSSLNSIVIHEAGHAVVAHQLRRPVGAMVWRTGADGIPYGAVVPNFREKDLKYIVFLVAGLVATYLDSIPVKRRNNASYHLMRSWCQTDDGIFAINVARDDLIKAGYYKPVDDASCLSLHEIFYSLREEVTTAIKILDDNWSMLNGLVNYARAQGRSLGRRELQQFLSGQRPRWWARLMDKPKLSLVLFEHWKFRDKIT